jgi:uncharacterized membrane protein
LAKGLLKEKRFIGLRARFDTILGSFWFTPLFMIATSVLLAILLNWLDMNGYFEWVPIRNPLNPDTVRGNLITITATLISLFGVMMSVALIPFSLAVGQYGHTVVAIYMKDKGIQNVTGWFGASIFYCASVLFIIPTKLDDTNMPDVTIMFSWVFFIGSLIVVIYFFNHIAGLLSAMTVANMISKQTMEEIENQRPYDRVYNYTPEMVEGFEATVARIRVDGLNVRSRRSGYVRGIDYNNLVSKAQRRNITILIAKSPGDYVAVGEPIVKYIDDRSLIVNRKRFWHRKRKRSKPEKVRSDRWLLKQRKKLKKIEHREALRHMIDETAISRWVNKSYNQGMQRSLLQDIDYGLQELVVMACTALSPAINAPLTAQICVDRLGLILGEISARPPPSPYKISRKEELRVISDPDTFERLMNTGFNQIRQYGHTQFEVMERQLNAIEAIAYRTTIPGYLNILQQHAELVRNEAHQFHATEWGRNQVEMAYLSAVKVINSKRGN